jgi:hypothetical protein
MIEYDEIANNIHPNDLAPESDLAGFIPAELGDLTSLNNLVLSGNSLSGEKRILPRSRSWMLLCAMESDCIP